jgi:hypothetical protein
MTPLERITKRVNQGGDANAPETRRPELTLEEFFEGNDVVGSIWCNLSVELEPPDAYEILKVVRSRPDVADIRIEITMFDDPAWPFSDTIWIVTSASPDDVRSWFDEDVAPDECDCAVDDVTREAFDVPKGMRAVRCWWD